MADEDDGFLRELVDLNRDANMAHVRYLDLKEQVSDAKKTWEAKVLEIQDAITDYGKELPLFDRKDHKPDDDSGGGWEDDGPPGPVSPPPSGGGDVIDVSFGPGLPQLPAPAFLQTVPAALRSDAWRDETIASLVDRFGFSEKTRDLLDEAGIRTIGSLADWNRESNRLQDIPGIGEAKAAEIEEIMDSFWSEWANRDVVQEPAERTEKPKRTRKKSA